MSALGLLSRELFCRALVVDFEADMKRVAHCRERQAFVDG